MNSLESVIVAVTVALIAAGAGGVWLIVQRQSPGTWRMMVARQDEQERETDELRRRVHQRNCLSSRMRRWKVFRLA